MEYENMRMPDVKSLARDCGLRNYSRMSKVELVAFLTIWVGIILHCAGPNRRVGRSQGLQQNLYDISIFGDMGSTPGPFQWGIKYCQ